METKPFIILLWCGLLAVTQAIRPKTLKRGSDLNAFMEGDQRTFKRHNYVVQRGLDNEVLGNMDHMAVYASEPLEPETAEDLPDLVVDYANMIRNDIILLDNSVETRTRKRGNIKVEKYNQALIDSPCNCEYSREPIDLGEDYYPRYIETRNCSKSLCSPLHECQKSIYNITVLRRKEYPKQETEVELPNDPKIRYGWIAVKKPIVVGCICTREVIARY